ncbi:uncharacterized protein LOC134779213 [Penaeus indicus]|uniref:uncharacterized protein LOC134779213 n=1 Tax=Penaeus indicus TaxID=29960 RepID=UPI00300C0F8A
MRLGRRVGGLVSYGLYCGCAPLGNDSHLTPTDRRVSRQIPEIPCADLQLQASNCEIKYHTFFFSQSLTETAVKNALHYDKGEDAQFVSWAIEDFLGQGDNYASTVTSVRVKYTQNGEDKEVSYIVKLKKKREGGSSSYFDDMTFEKEGRFFIELCPLLNAELLEVGLTPLKVPRCCHSTWSENQDFLFLVDLRPKGFKRYDRKKVLDDSHANLVLQELARLHAASFLLRKKMKDDLVSSSSTLAFLMGYGTGSEWFKDATSRGCEIFEEQLRRGSFDVIGHGDCCTNNMLVRYNAKENPVEVLFLDFQLCRQASLAVDLNYFFFSNFDRKDRKEKMGQYLSLYHSSFAKVLASASLTMPYTVEEITKEFKRKNTYGIICGSILIPLLVSETQEVIDFDSASGGCAKGYVEELRQNAVRMLANNPLLKPRMTDSFEDLKESHGL